MRTTNGLGGALLTEVTISINNLREFSTYREALRTAGLQPGFVEILWDNYCHIDPHALATMLAEVSPRVALHIMWSRFLELDEEALCDYLGRLRRHVEVLRPVYVSDHLCRFRIGAFFLAAPLELDYTDLGHVRERVLRYQ